MTGGAGFIGRAIVRQLVGRGERVRVVDKKAVARWMLDGAEPTAPLVDYITADLSQPGVARAALNGVDAVVHCAAETHNDDSIVSPREFVQSNILATFELLEAARRTNTRFHHVSTDEVYGDVPVGMRAVLDEYSPTRASSPYSATKAGSDQLVHAWGRSYGLPVTISNGTNTYGPYQGMKKFIPRQVELLSAGRPAELYGDGHQQRDWLHVDDHARAIIDILDRGKVGQRYLINGGTRASNKELLALILDTLRESPDHWVSVPDRPGHDERYGIDDSKLRWSLGWEPRRTDLPQGIADTLAWYLQHRDIWEML